MQQTNSNSSQAKEWTLTGIRMTIQPSLCMEGKLVPLPSKRSLSFLKTPIQFVLIAEKEEFKFIAGKLKSQRAINSLPQLFSKRLALSEIIKFKK